MKALRVFVSFILLLHVGSTPVEIGLDTTIGAGTTGASEGTTAGETEAATGGTEGTGGTGGTGGCAYFLQPILLLLLYRLCRNRNDGDRGDRNHGDLDNRQRVITIN